MCARDLASECVRTHLADELLQHEDEKRRVAVADGPDGIVEAGIHEDLVHLREDRLLLRAAVVGGGLGHGGWCLY